MIFSVFDPNARCFNYYEAPGNSSNYGARGTKYRALSQGPQTISTSVMGLGGGRGERACIGYAPEALALKLPAGAKHVGRGDVAKGIIAVGGSMSGLGAVHHAPYAERFQGARPRMNDTNIHPAYPGRFEEEGGTYNGYADSTNGFNGFIAGRSDVGLGGLASKVASAFGGLGADAPAVEPEQHVIATTPFSQIVLAASIAAIVGVVVQKILK